MGIHEEFTRLLLCMNQEDFTQWENNQKKMKDLKTAMKVLDDMENSELYTHEVRTILKNSMWLVHYRIVCLLLLLLVGRMKKIRPGYFPGLFFFAIEAGPIIGGERNEDFQKEKETPDS